MSPTDVSVVSKRPQSLDDRVNSLKTRVAVMEHRLDGGTASFAEIRSTVASNHGELKAAIAKAGPKEVDWSRVLFSIFAACMTVGGLIYAVSDKFSERPRFDQTENMLRPIRRDQTAMENTIEELRTKQFKQQATIEAIERESSAQDIRLQSLRDRKRR